MTKIVDEPTGLIAEQSVSATVRPKADPVDSRVTARAGLREALAGKSLDNVVAAMEVLMEAHIEHASLSEVQNEG